MLVFGLAGYDKTTFMLLEYIFCLVLHAFLTCLENDILRFSLALTRCDFLMEDTSAGLQFKANKPVKLRKAIALLQMVAMS